MDADRVRAYLQVACTGLGFDIGEIWWSADENGSSSALMAIEDNDGGINEVPGSDGKNLRFVQLYTSKSYEDRRSMLVRPTDEEDEENQTALVTNNDPRRNDSNKDLEKHVLSPLLVDAISKTAQVVWAHTKKQEGLLGRSDIRLQTAVGMPVAVDGSGNMCVVVMFSPNNIQSTDDAMEYLQSISKSATSTSIPSLLPAFDPKQGLISIPHHHPSNERIALLSSPALVDGVTTRFVSLDESPAASALSVAEVHSDHDLSSAPKDCFGIPMLPSVAEISGTNKDLNGHSVSDAFDEASYGIWSTIMDTIEPAGADGFRNSNNSSSQGKGPNGAAESPLYILNKPKMPRERRIRLEEFASAFLEVSVFDFAEVWIPVGGQADYLGQVTSIASTDSNPLLNEFIQSTEKILIKSWSGSIGRAFASGNPVWSSNKDVFVDSGRANFFGRVKLETALAIPVFSGKSTTPSFIFSCYSFVRSGTVPFVLKFVQQALRLLWSGLDKIQPHSSVEDSIWKELEPADLGEMAADVEMQQHFMNKKRPHRDISAKLEADSDPALAIHFESMEPPSGIPSVRSIYTGPGSSSSPTLDPLEASPQMGPTNPPPIQQEAAIATHNYQYQTFNNIQGHIQNAVRSIGDMNFAHQHIATNEQGSKRAHVYMPMETSQPQQQQQQQPLGQYQQPMSHMQHQAHVQNPSSMAAPLPMPRPLAAPTQVLVNPSSPRRPNSYQGMSSIQPQQDSIQAMNMTSQSQPPQQQATLPQNYAYRPPNIQSSQAPSPPNSKPITAPVASIPKNQISATGISFPVPSSGMPTSTPTSVNSSQFCMPVNQHTAAPTSKVNSNGKPCRIKGCNEPSVARRPYCVRHSGNRMCEHDGCTKCAQGATRFCIAHGGGRRCTFAGCDKGARDKFFCAAHGGGKRCKFDGCNKSAVGGSSLCTAHGGGRRCCVEGCEKSAQSSTKFCVKHGGGKKCSHPNCEKVARGRTQFCAAHGGGVRCKLEGCSRVAIGKFQLCRAHGGGVRSKKNSQIPPPVPTSAASVVSLGGLPTNMAGL